MRVTVAGDVNPDVLFKVRELPSPDSQVHAEDVIVKLGGSAANTAAALAALGVDVYFYGCVGRDFFGKMCRRWLSDFGVSGHFAERGKTGITVGLEIKVGRSLITYRGANALLKPEDVEILGDWFHFAGFWNCIGIAEGLDKLYEKAKDEGCITSFDPGSVSKERENVEKIFEVVENGLVDILFISEEEARLIFGDDLPELPVLLHKGPRGVSLVTPEGRYDIETVEVRPAVRTGAGDVLNAGFIYGYLQTKDMKKALEYAVKTVYKYLISGSFK